MRVLITWAHPQSANLGVRALAEGTASIIRETFGNSTEIEFQNASTAFGMRDIVKDVLTGKQIRGKIKHFDLVLDTGGGDSFTDIYGTKRLLTLAYTHFAADKVNVPFVLGPQTIGPFRKTFGKSIAEHSLKRALAVFARDSVSKELANSLGVKAFDSTDVVFALPEVKPPTQKSFDVLFNVSGLLWTANSHADAEKYRNSVRKCISQLQEQGREVTLLAHVLDNPSLDNDVPAITQLSKELAIKAIIPVNLQDARETISSSNLVIASRMHACLNALSVSVPAIAWAYSRKFAPLLGDLGWQNTISLATAEDPADLTTQLLVANSPTSLASEAAAVKRRAMAKLSIEIKELQSLIEDD